jgi:hypothetical protein
VSVTPAVDITHANLGHLPKVPAQVAGYTTGSMGIAWTAADWKAHPGAVRIDQDAAAADHTADVLDVERGAATEAECPGWVKKATVNWQAVTRAGQRHPAIYMSASRVSAVVNALVAGGVQSGVGLWVANWNLTSAEAIQEVVAASGPYPIIGIQFTDSPVFYDLDVFSTAWLDEVSVVVPPQPPPVKPPVRHEATGAETMAGAARAHGMSVPEVLWLTAHSKPAGYGPLERPYINAGNWGARMPQGMWYWTRG